MPKYQGIDICDWVEVIAKLKREGDLQQALGLASACMQAMQAEALRNPANVMEYYVAQVAIIQRKLKDYKGEIRVLEGWLGLGLPPTREDHHLDLLKRLAKARELQAKKDGEDPSVYTAEWKRLVQAEKAVSPHQSAPATGRSAVSGSSYSRTSRWVAPATVLRTPSFVAVDFETANTSRVSACQIAMVRIERGRIVDRFATLLAPPRGFDAFEFTYLHGISARDVRRSPSWAQISQQVAQFSGASPVFAHNASFDAGVWKALDEFYACSTLPRDFYCSYRTAKGLVPGLENYKLPTVTQALVPGYHLDHHRAESDAEACGLIVAALARI